jgi:hypothetical protein
MKTLQRLSWVWSIGAVCLLIVSAGSAVQAQSSATASVMADTVTIDAPTRVDFVPLAEPPTLSPAELTRLQQVMEMLPLRGPAPLQVGVPQPPPPGSETGIAGLGPRPAAPNDFRFFHASTPNPVIPSDFKATVNEPSTGMSGRVRFMTGNWYAAFSNNGGGTWAFLSPFTTFPASDGGFCCDQTVLYEPSRDMMLWQLQYIKSGSTANDRGRLRLAVFANTNNNIGGAGWFFYDILPSMVGGPASGEWFDYPHMALSNDFLYIAVNVFTTTLNPRTGMESFTRSVMMRLDLDPIRAGTGLSGNYLSWTANFTFTPIQGAKDVMYWASHTTTSNMRIFRWEETSASIQIFDQAIAAWVLGTASCPTSDGQDWCLRSDFRILAGARSWNHLARQSELWFFWNVSQGGGFARPHIDAARFRESDLAYVARPFIFNDAIPILYVAAAPNARGDIGLSLSWGNPPGFFPSHAVCLDDDVNGDPPGWECYVTRIGTNGPNNNAWGDYLAVRPDHPASLGWHATGFTLQGGKDGANVEPLNLIFGRERDQNSSFRWNLR